MDTSYTTVLLKILNAIEYREDKEKFANKFIQTTSQQTLVDLVTALPVDKQSQIKKEFSEANTQEKVTDVLKKYFTDEQR